MHISNITFDIILFISNGCHNWRSVLNAAFTHWSHISSPSATNYTNKTMGKISLCRSLSIFFSLFLSLFLFHSHTGIVFLRTLNVYLLAHFIYTCNVFPCSSSAFYRVFIFPSCCVWCFRMFSFYYLAWIKKSLCLKHFISCLIHCSTKSHTECNRKECLLSGVLNAVIMHFVILGYDIS